MGPMPDKQMPTGEDRLWWAVIRSAAKDLRYARKSLALDAGDWLTGSGTHLVSFLYHIDCRVTIHAILALIRQRNRYHEEPIEIPAAAKS